jgi:hypothetical protein
MLHNVSTHVLELKVHFLIYNDELLLRIAGIPFDAPSTVFVVFHIVVTQLGARVALAVFLASY